MSLKNKKTSSRKAANENSANFSRDVSLLIKTTTSRDQLLIKLLATTGITPNELVQLRKQDLKGLKLHIQAAYTKHKQPRVTQLTPQLAREFAQHTSKKQPEEHIFSTRQSSQLTTRRVEQILAQASRQAGIKPITPRDLRKAYLAQATRTAQTDEELKDLTGLKSITKRRTLTTKEVQRLTSTLKSTKQRDRTLVNLLLETSISASEAANLRSKDIHQTHICLPTRTIPVSQKLSRSLRTTKEFVFSTRQSSQLTTRRIEQIVSALGVKARIPDLTPSVLRATAITAAATVDVEEARKKAGLKTPLFYTHGLMRGGAP